jgi:hypothetical protein
MNIGLALSRNGGGARPAKPVGSLSAETGQRMMRLNQRMTLGAAARKEDQP